MFDGLAQQLRTLVLEWEYKLSGFDDELISIPKNKQNRSIKQIVGHMVDSASNNTHRVVHLQYRESPVEFPNYATYGNNEKWIAIQNYRDEDWGNLVQLWKYSHLHFIHVIGSIDPGKLDQKWVADENELVSLKDMVEDFPRHFELHIAEIEQIIKQYSNEES